ncbi:hypothetical protein [Cryobacterium sp. CG_9.6]|uniref:ABC transporter permease n=1 Tax=Cryobacterium sp. CG_9.6 TaxID=2760710 RepID=UPI0024735372|nr:hypothetical protein [Cryobacterium sp. CG_9.6]MDH6235507.1 ABC-2 type transport system permease protein [Cryobacterium sp. CG_9.6]
MNTIGTLCWLRARRDGGHLTVWITALAVLVSLSVPAVTVSFGSTADREALVRLAIGAPSVLMLRGIPQGANVDALLFFQLFTFLAVMVALMNTFLAVRHSRAEEESGRADLVGATSAGRLKPLIATVLHGVGTNVLTGTVVAGGFVAAGLQVRGALVSGLALGATGLVFLAVGLLSSQVMRTSRGANGLAAALVGVAYALRAAGDAAGSINPDGLSMTSAWPSWLSPIGWGQQTSAFTANDATPLLLDLALAAVLLATVGALQSRRDLGASLLSGRAGRAHAADSLRGSASLIWRLHWPAVAGWCVVGLVFGLLAGTLGETVRDLVRSNADMLAALSSITDGPTPAGTVSDGTIVDVFVAAMFSIVGVVAAAAATQTMIRMRQDEVNRTAELLLATGLTRIRWLLDYVLVGVIASSAVLLVAVIGGSVGLLRSPGPAERLGSVLAAGVAQLPAALLILTIAAALFTYVPLWCMGLSWAVLVSSVFIGQFGGLLGLSEAIRALSPFTHTPLVAVPGTDWSGAGVMLALAVAVALLASLGMRRRELST